MDEIANNNKKGFFRHVFNMDENSRNELWNISQYSLVAFLPVIFFNKIIQKFIPEANEDKSSLEMSLEIVFQVVIVFVGIFFLHRIVTYFPTYSGQPYSAFDPTHMVILGLIIFTSMSTKLGEKVAILSERAVEYWNGGRRTKTQTQGSGQGSGQGTITGNLMTNPPPQVINQPSQSTPQTPPTQYVQQGGIAPILAANEALSGGGFGGSSLF